MYDTKKYDRFRKKPGSHLLNGTKPILPDVDTLIDAIVAFSERCNATGDPLLLPGLASSLNMSANTLFRLQKGTYDNGDGKGERPYKYYDPEDMERIKGALDLFMTDSEYELAKLVLTKQAARGAIYLLGQYNNYGPEDQTKVTAPDGITVRFEGETSKLNK